MALLAAELLRAHGVEQFTRLARSRSLHAVKIGYRHMKALGGLRHSRAESTNLG